MLRERQLAILRATLEKGSLTIEQIARRFAVSAGTARRDVGKLADGGLVARRRGVVQPTAQTAEVVYIANRNVPRPERKGIGAVCARCVSDGSMVFLGAGLSDEAIARALAGQPDLVITNSLRAAKALETKENTDLIVVGGILRRTDCAIVGEAAVEFIGRFRADYAIVEAAAIDQEGTVLGHDYLDVNVTHAFIANARKAVIVLADDDAGGKASIRIADLQDVAAIVTPKPVHGALASICDRLDIDIYRPDNVERLELEM